MNDALRQGGESGLEIGVTARSRSRPGATLSIVYVAWILSLAGTQLFSILLFFLLPATLAGLVNWGTAGGAVVFYVAEGGVETALVIAAKQRAMSVRRMTSVVGAIRAITAFLAIAAWFVAVGLHWIDGLPATVLLLVGIGFALRSFQTPFSAALQVNDRQATVAILNLAGAGVRLVGLALVWMAGLVSVTSVLIASLAGDFVALVGLAAMASGLRSARREQDPSAQELAIRLLKAAPLITASQATTIVQARIDWLLVAAFTSYASLANYSIANKALELFMLAGSVFGRTALPWFVEGWESRRILGAVRTLMATTTIGGLGLAVFGARLLHLAFGAKYAGADVVIPVLAVLAPGLVAFLVVQFAMLGKNRALDTVIAGLAGIVAQVALDLFAIPRLGILGAAYGMCAFTLIALPTCLWLAARRGIVGRSVVLELAGASALLPAIIVAGSVLHP